MADQTPQTATSSQMSLALFEDMLAEGFGIHEAAVEIGFQRNNVFVDIADLGVAARRLVDAAYFIVAQEQQSPRLYDVELSYFRWLMRYDSYNYKHLRAVISEAQKALVQVTDTPPGEEPSEKDVWVSVQLLGPVGLSNGRIAFEVPAILVRHIKDPANSHWLSLRISTAFTLNYARAIYDHVLPFISKGGTDWIPLEVVRSWPGKASASSAAFKYFKRDYLEPAMRQINELSDIELSYETRKTSRSIDRIRFKAVRKEGALPAMQQLLGAQEIYFTLKNEFGLTEKQFNEISANRNTWTDEWIERAVEFTRVKITQGKVSRSPSGFLMKALRENLSISDAERTMMAVQSKIEAEEQAKVEAQEAKHKARAADQAAQENAAKAKQEEEVHLGEAILCAMDATNRKELLDAYFVSTAGRLLIRKLKLDKAPLTEADVMLNPDLKQGFCHFAYLKYKPKAKQLVATA
ncbi:RepB family plasmid replication initiator protein [Crenobacter sp. SG2303]|uniref:RepB family plasmid replication initiator protein n=1 Tax=Crenobacter oryzisoli TaxID=3056844 RepID=A0ABT7XUF4_9NEIS|nr:RepB family plasmid replication initiator protein [Crenobacter sp. SG2303]MDN0077430.1 RepB family plasmid replication initiator protein [Crenobacter sp. SG2303]